MRKNSLRLIFSLFLAVFIFSAQNTSEADCTGTILIAKNSNWKYEASGANLGTAWRAASYNDGGWSSGNGILGFGETYITTVLPSGHITYYFRKAFTLTDPVASIAQLTLLANYDDGFVAYLNGQEVTRQAMPAGTISYTTLASLHEGGVYQSIDLTAHLSKLVAGNNVLAVEVHQASTTSSDVVMDMELSYQLGTATACVTRGPYLQIGTPSQISVRWRTSLATDSRVQYGTEAGNLTLVADDPAVTTEHEVLLSGFAPSTAYFYSVGSTSGSLASGADYYFVTAPPTGSVKKTRVWVLGDAGTANSNQAAVRDAYYNFTGATHTDLWVMLGDNAYNSGTDGEYQAAVFDMYPAMLRKSVLWPAFGNHDGYSADSPTQTGPFYDGFTLPKQGEAGGVASGTEAYYAFDFANIHFICLNSEDIPRTPTGAMLTWLQQDLAANTKNWTIAFWHHPPYSKGSHNSDTETQLIEMRQNALPILENGGVDLVLTGHSHSYERSFLLDGHYGTSGTLTGNMILDGGSGRDDGDGAYSKPTFGPASHEGAVYVVAGSSGQISGGSLNHPAMYVSLNSLGSVVLDVDNDRADVTFLDQLGATRDYFTMIKGGAPAAPSNLTAAAINSSQINLAWTDNAGDEDGFRIERKTGAAGIYTVIATTSANATSYSNAGLTGGTAYYYRVRAYKGAANSSYSNEANATTPSSNANLALNQPATALTSNGSNPPGNAVDGSTSTYWRSGSVSSNTVMWWRVDLGASYSISRVVIKWRSSYYAQKYQIQVSSNGATFTTVHTDNSGNGGTDEVTFAATPARYVRVYMTKNNKATERINEVEVYADAGTALSKASNRAIDAVAIPEEITLAPNYPNPFNPSTRLSYSLPQGMNVTLNVVNLTGQIVATPASGYHERGVYRITFNAANLPSGVYFAVLKAGEVTQVRRMLLMR